jgi:ribosome-associated protein
MAMQSRAMDGMIAATIACRPTFVPTFRQFRYTVRLFIIINSLTQGEHLQGKALQDFVIDKIDDLKGQDIVAIDVHGKSSITDCMIICTGTSTRHVMSIADHVVQRISRRRHAAAGR